MKFLSINEVVKNYKASRTTITRFARTHQQTKNVKKENGKYFILDSFLDTHFLRNNQTSQKTKTNNQLTKTVSQTEQQKESSTKENQKEKELELELELELVKVLKNQNEFLQSQIDKKDSQILEKDKQIEKLLQRQSEQNIIIQSLQNRFDGIGNKIDSSVLLISDKVKENKNVVHDKQNDNGFTMASAILILLAVALLVLFVAYN